MTEPLTYAQYYARCRAFYGDSDPELTVYTLRVHPHYADNPKQTDLLSPGCEFNDAVSALEREICRRLVNVENLYKDASPSTRQLALQLDNFWGIPAVETLASILVPQLEDRVFRSYALVNQINILRTFSTDAPPASSWLWHYDNNPAESLKILIYLNDVTGTNGPFEYLRNVSSGEGVKIETSRVVPGREDPPKWKGSRVPPAEIDRLLASGYEAQAVVGSKATFVLFDNNCIHRATIPVEGHRDAFILHIRPSHEKIRPFISPNHTGSWGYDAKRWRPDNLEISSS